MRFSLDGKASVDGVREALGMFYYQHRAISSLDPLIEILHEVASDVNKLKRQLFSNVAISSRNHSTCLAGDKLQRDICRWLSPPDPWKNHHVARESHHTGTAAWFVHGNTFSEWKSSPPGSLLWIHGKRGLPLGAYGFAEADSLTLS